MRRFGLKTGIDFAHFVLWNRVWFSRELRKCCEFQFQMSKKLEKNIRIQNGFDEFLCLRSDLINDYIISA